LKDSTEAELSQSLFVLSEAAITNVREALESLLLPGASASADTTEATALLTQVTEVQARLFEQQHSFASQLEASVQVQAGLETQMQQWQSLIESVDLNGLALRLEQLEQTATALNAPTTAVEPTLLPSLSERLSQLERQSETIRTLQPTLDSLCDRTAELHSQLQALQESATADVASPIAALEARYQALAAQLQQARSTATDSAELDNLQGCLESSQRALHQS
ncbi:MAG: hypothetical protein HC926_04350, partial [Synechococcaceae cyanobacterium SM2_3_60]|nr:hypothetical protein [Synechococcaceae cyanobacterium SM2_3_60]